MKRLFWLGVGIIAGVAISRKAGEAARQATPAGIAGNLGTAISELAGAIGTFGAEVRAGMAEREEELHQVVESQAGVSVRRGLAPIGGSVETLPRREPRHALRSIPPADSYRAVPSSARARRAGG